jgi:hypothetical protein
VRSLDLILRRLQTTSRDGHIAVLILNAAYFALATDRYMPEARNNGFH